MSVMSFSLANCSTSFMSWAFGIPVRGFLILRRDSKPPAHGPARGEYVPGGDVPAEVDVAAPLSVTSVVLVRGGALLLCVGHGVSGRERRRRTRAAERSTPPYTC